MNSQFSRLCSCIKRRIVPMRWVIGRCSNYSNSMATTNERKKKKKIKIDDDSQSATRNSFNQFFPQFIERIYAELYHKLHQKFTFKFSSLLQRPKKTNTFPNEMSFAWRRKIKWLPQSTMVIVQNDNLNGNIDNIMMLRTFMVNSLL